MPRLKYAVGCEFKVTNVYLRTPQPRTATGTKGGDLVRLFPHGLATE